MTVWLTYVSRGKVTGNWKSYNWRATTNVCVKICNSCTVCDILWRFVCACGGDADKDGEGAGLALFFVQQQQHRFQQGDSVRLGWRRWAWCYFLLLECGRFRARKSGVKWTVVGWREVWVLYGECNTWDFRPRCSQMCALSVNLLCVT